MTKDKKQKRVKIKDALKICEGCKTRQLTKNPYPIVPIPDFYTCGEYGIKVPGKSCGCVISLKTILAPLGLQHCPQEKW